MLRKVVLALVLLSFTSCPLAGLLILEPLPVEEEHTMTISMPLLKKGLVRFVLSGQIVKDNLIQNIKKVAVTKDPAITTADVYTVLRELEDDELAIIALPPDSVDVTLGRPTVESARAVVDWNVEEDYLEALRVRGAWTEGGGE